MQVQSLQESHLRSVLKGLTWRLVATATIILLAWWKTGDVSFALELGAIEFVLKFVLYYMHERAWARIPQGALRIQAIRRRRAMQKSLRSNSKNRR